MFKILSIDGGGAKTLLSIYIIQEIENLLKEEGIADSFPKFDLYAGTSAGSIVASALAIHKTPNEIGSMFEELSPKIFPKTYFKRIKIAIKSLYSTEILHQKLKHIFKNITFDDVFNEYNSRLLIPVTSIKLVKPMMLKTPHKAPDIDPKIKGKNNFTRDKNIYLYDAITASSVAPLFFNPHNFSINNPEETENMYCTDGGLYLCNPSLAAITEVQKYITEDKNLDNIKVLSISNIATRTSYSYDKKPWWLFLTGWGILTRWGHSKLIESVMDLQKVHTHQIVSFHLLEKNYIRLEDLSKNSIDVDCDIREHKEFFKEKAREMIELNKNKIINFFKEV